MGIDAQTHGELIEFAQTLAKKTEPTFKQMELFQNDKPFQLYGDHFICNISLDENLPGGLIGVNRDPRKQKHKPDTYVARVERVSSSCKLVKPGEKIVIERFDWLQYDLDEERIIARETDVVILGDDKPAPGIAVLGELTKIEEVNSLLYIPDASIQTEKQERNYIYGQVIHSAVPAGKTYDALKVGDFVWMYKRDRDQWRLGKTLIIFRFSTEMVFMIGEKCEQKKTVELAVA